MLSPWRATVCLPDLLSDEQLNDFPLNVAPLLPLPDERVERSELGIWTDWLLRPLKLRDESLPDDERDFPDELLDDVMREDED